MSGKKPRVERKAVSLDTREWQRTTYGTHVFSPSFHLSHAELSPFAEEDLSTHNVYLERCVCKFCCFQNLNRISFCCLKDSPQVEARGWRDESQPEL